MTATKYPQPVMLRLVLEGTIPSKKNNKILKVNKAGKPYQTTAAHFKKWMREKAVPKVEAWLLRQLEERPEISFPIDAPLKCSIMFYFGDKRTRDLGNKEETIYDLLVDCGVIKNDSCYVVSKKSCDWMYRKGKPGADVYLTFR